MHMVIGAGKNCCAFGNWGGEILCQPYLVMNMHKTVSCFLGGWENWANPVLLHPDNLLPLLMLSLVMLVSVGKEWAGPVFPHPLKSKGCIPMHDRFRLMLLLVRIGKEWTSPVFLHLDLHMVDALSFQGGEEWAGPVLPHSLKSKCCTCMCIHDRVRLMLSLLSGRGRGGGDGGRGRMDQLVFLYQDNHLHKVDALSYQVGERMGWPSFSPTPEKQRLYVYS